MVVNRLFLIPSFAFFAVFLLGQNSFADVLLPENSTSPAESVDFMRGIRAAGMGEAYTAIATETSGIYHNPAGVARALTYAMEGAFEYTPSGTLLNVGVVDSKTNPGLAAGLGYSYFFGRGDRSQLTAHDLRLAVGIPVSPDRVSVGVAGRYIWMHEGVDEDDEKIYLLKGFTLDAGVVLRAADQLHIGISGQNLIDPCNDDDSCKGMAPTTISAGAALELDSSFLLSGNFGVDLSSAPSPAINLGVGAEYQVNGIVPIRVGFMRKGAFEHNFLTAGLGWRSPQAGIDVSYQHNLQKSSEVGYIAGSIALYF